MSVTGIKAIRVTAENECEKLRKDHYGMSRKMNGSRRDFMKTLAIAGAGR